MFHSRHPTAASAVAVRDQNLSARSALKAYASRGAGSKRLSELLDGVTRSTSHQTAVAI
eukprot:m.559946 g.559946  ORF g.559946 m.559946 type:complete len:59 (+) comp57784_c1_seq5:1032-1208(+)